MNPLDMKVPLNWQVIPLKRLCRLVTEKATQRTSAVALENIESWSGKLIEGVSDFSGDGVAFQKQDILFGKLRPYLAKVWLAEFNGEAVGDFHVLRTSTCLYGRYTFYQLIMPEIISQIDGSTYGAKMPRASWDFMGNLNFFVPPLADQKLISSFLDRETVKIDALIEEQKRLIELLKEKRQAVISHAVTKGLDPSVPMKDSGVEWLGQVPAHWSVKPLRYLGTARNGLTYTPENICDELSGTLVLRSSNVQSDEIVLEDNVYVDTKINPDLMVQPGDILICSRNGSRALIGKNAQITSKLGPATFGAFMMIFRSSYNDFLKYVFRSSLFAFQSSLFLTSTINQLTISNLYEFKVPLPPEQEQIKIVEYLSEKCINFNQLISQSEAAVNLLHERRAALISAAVTGKIDVRGLASDKAEAA